MSSPFTVPRHRLAVRSVILACVTALLLAGCGAAPSADAPPVPVVLAAAEPNAALPGTTVTLRGSGFVDGLALAVGGQPLTGTLLGPDALSFVVPDTTGYPVIELGDASGERLLFVGAQYTGVATTSGVQAVLDALAPGIALRLPALTITGDHLVVADRALYGSGSGANGTRLEVQGTAWLIVGADLAELNLRASQVIIVPEGPADPSTPFDSLSLADATATDAATSISTRISDVSIDLVDEPTTVHRSIEAIAGAASVTFEDVRIDGLAVSLYVDAFVARQFAMTGPDFSVYAITTLDVSDAAIDVEGYVDLTAQDPGRYVLARIEIDAGLDVKLDTVNGDPDAVAEVSDLRAHSAHDVEIRPEATARLRALDLAGIVVRIESNSRDLDLENATLYADDTVWLLADNGALALTDVDLTLGPDAADALHGLNPASLYVRGRLGVDVLGGTWNAGPTALLSSKEGAIIIADLHVEADEWIELQPEGDVTITRASFDAGSFLLVLEVEGSVAIADSEVVAYEMSFEVEDGTLRLTDVHLDGEYVTLYGNSAVAVDRSTIAARCCVQFVSGGPIDIDESSFSVVDFEIWAEEGGFTLRRGRLVATGRVVLSSEGGPGVIEDMAMVVRSLDGLSATSDVRLELRRTSFAFAVPIVFDAPPGELVLEDVTGADHAETPGQP